MAQETPQQMFELHVRVRHHVLADGAGDGDGDTIAEAILDDAGLRKAKQYNCNWSGDDKRHAAEVCRRFDELAHLLNWVITAKRPLG